MTARDDLAAVVLQTDPHNGIHPGERGFPSCHICRSLRQEAEQIADAVIREWVPSLWVNENLIEKVATTRAQDLPPTTSVLRALADVLREEPHVSFP